MIAARVAVFGSILLAVVACATVEDIDASNSGVSSNGGAQDVPDGASEGGRSGGASTGGATSNGGTAATAGSGGFAPSDASPGEEPDSGVAPDASTDSGTTTGSGGTGSGGVGSGGRNTGGTETSGGAGGSTGGAGGSSGGAGGNSGGAGGSGGQGGSGGARQCDEARCPSCLISGLLGAPCCRNATTCGCRALLGIFQCQ